MKTDSGCAACVVDPVDTSHLQIYADHMAKIFHLISASQTDKLKQIARNKNKATVWAAVPWGSTPTPPALQVEEGACSQVCLHCWLFLPCPAPLPGLSQSFFQPVLPLCALISDGALDLTVCARAAARPRKLLVMQLHSSSKGTKWLWKSKWAR